MPLRRGGFSRRAMALRPVNSNKNVFYSQTSVGTTIVTTAFANAVDAAALSTTSEVTRGCTIKSIWLSLDFCGLAATGVQQDITVYMMKNPGNNLTPPNPRSEGSSNEKKFIIKTWNAMTMRNQDGNPPYHWEGWIKIPKRYQRMGASDEWELSSISTTAAGHMSFQAIYKWYF